jgi:uncharacterized protein
MNRIISILLCFCLFATACAQKGGLRPTGYINDFERIFSTSEASSLDSLVKAFEKETSAEIVVVTLNGNFAPAEKFDSMAIVLYNAWGIGKKGKNNGVLIAICNDYRRIRITNGYGIEAKMTDAETKEIMDKIILPEFRKQEFYEGIRKGILAIMKEIR